LTFRKEKTLYPVAGSALVSFEVALRVDRRDAFPHLYVSHLQSDVLALKEQGLDSREGE
jgi:hypothetical protein